MSSSRTRYARLEVLDDLHGDQPAERAVRQRLEVRERVALARVEAARPAGLDHLVVDVEAVRADAALGEQRQELAAAAPEVEHVRRAREQLDVLAAAARGSSDSDPLNLFSKPTYLYALTASKTRVADAAAAGARRRGPGGAG